MNQNDLDRWVVKVGIQGGNHKIEGEKQNIFLSIKQVTVLYS